MYTFREQLESYERPMLRALMVTLVAVKIHNTYSWKL
jgi:hypothetical protein